MRIFFLVDSSRPQSVSWPNKTRITCGTVSALLTQNDVPRTGRKGINTMPDQSMNIPDTTLTPISFNGFCRKRLLSRMVSPVRQALFQLGYRYVRERCGELLEG